jgi:hypothetical protein
MGATEPGAGPSRRAPPDLWGRRGVRLLVAAPLALVVGASLVVALAVAYGQLRRGPDPAQEAERAARLEAILEEAAAAVPGYPGAVRLAEVEGATLLGTAPARHACWRAPAPLAEVLTYYRRALPAREGPAGGGWRVRGTSAAGELLSAERGQVRLLVHDPAAGAVVGLACPPGTTYAVSLTVFRVPPGQH